MDFQKLSSATFKDGEANPVHRCINIKETRNKYRHLLSIERGYKGLFWYLLFLVWYVYIIAKQHRATQVGDVNSALQICLDKQKSDLVTKDSKSLYNFMSTKIVPILLSSEWSTTSAGGKHLSGHVTNDYYQVVGGVVLTAKKSRTKQDCFHGYACYSEDEVVDPFYNVTLPGKQDFFQVPYDERFQGYSLVIPSSGQPKHLTSLMTAYKDLFGESTRKISVQAVLFNPSGTATLTFLEFSAAVSVHNNIKFTTQVKTIPYLWYLPLSKYFDVASQLLFLVFTFYLFILPMWSVYFRKPKKLESCHDPAQMHAWVESIEKWVNTWHLLPQVGGRAIMSTPLLIYGLMGVSVWVWLYLGYRYTQLGDFAHSQWLFEDFELDPENNDIQDLYTASLKAMHKRILPLINAVDGITNVSQWYFSVHVVILAFVIWRIQQYLIFQRHLSMVADTFTGIYDDLIHMSLVLVLVCFIFGVINSLAVGNYDEAFQTIVGSFFTMLEVTFGLYKPAADTPYVQSLYKYSPHVLRSEATLNWLPLVINVAFKTLVMMLLFKLLMGVVMEGYKKHKPKEHVASVRDNMATLYTAWKLKIFRMYLPAILNEKLQRCLGLKRGYVPFVHLALAVSHYQKHLDKDEPCSYYEINTDCVVTEERSSKSREVGKLAKGIHVTVEEVVALEDELLLRGRIASPECGWINLVEIRNGQDKSGKGKFTGNNKLDHLLADGKRWADKQDECRAWKKAYVGLDESQHILSALNALVDPKNTRRSPALRRLVEKHRLDWCDTTHLEYVLEEFGENRQRARVAFAEALIKKKEEKEKKEKMKKDKQAKLRGVQEQLDKMQERWHGDMDSVRFLSAEGRKAFYKFTKETFEKFDFLRIGTIDIRHMSFALEFLGFRMQEKKLADLLAKHDANGDGNFSLAELETLVLDNALIGRFKAPDHLKERLNKQGVCPTSGLFEKSIVDKEVDEEA